MTQKKLRLLDLFCKAGGASFGYDAAGFSVTGIDHEPQKRYPFAFARADAMEVLANTAYLNRFDVVAASPPCQCYSVTKHLSNGTHPDLVEPVRRLLQAWGGPYVIENVVGAPLLNPVRLCGSSFGLDVRRHRLFESNMMLRGVACRHRWQTPRFPALYTKGHLAGRLSSVICVSGHNPARCQPLASTVVSPSGKPRYAGGVADWKRAMGIDWMVGSELAQAVPPAYTEYLGLQIVDIITRSRAIGTPFSATFPSTCGVPSSLELE